ncbi:MAG TPA: helix-turn-helix domain-containing protein [Streptomyces sp.]|nr:helix-turn-helix domain-containing protein [Streptomyces sp.]
MRVTAAQAPSIVQLGEVVDALAPAVSASRLRQLRWVAGELRLALDDPVMPESARTGLGGLLADEAVLVYLTLAAAGRLRRVDTHRAGPSRASMSVRVSCLRQLGQAAGVEVVVPSVPQPDPKPEIPAAQQAALYRRLVDLAAGGPLTRDGTALSFEDRTRLLAVVAVVLDTGARSGELAEMRLADLDLDAGTVSVRRRAQRAPTQETRRVAARLGVHEKTVLRVLAGDADEYRISEETRQAVQAVHRELFGGPVADVFRLREGTAVAVRRWLAVRERLVAPLEGAKDALWVSLAANGAGPAGLPLQPRGLRRAYARGVVALNWVMAGEYGWAPLPTSLEVLRRSVEVRSVGDGPGPVFERRPGGRRARAWTGKERDRALALLADPGVTVDEVARELGVSLEVLYRDVPEARSRPGLVVDMAEYVTTDEAAALLGVSRRTVHGYLRRRVVGFPRPVRVGRGMVFSRRALVAWRDGS